jgi:hypothetical protein
MTEKDIVFLVGAAMGALGAYTIGHLRGQCVGINWMAKLYSLPLPPADHQPTEKTEASQS